MTYQSDVHRISRYIRYCTFLHWSSLFTYYYVQFAKTNNSKKIGKLYLYPWFRKTSYKTVFHCPIGCDRILHAPSELFLNVGRTIRSFQGRRRPPRQNRRGPVIYCASTSRSIYVSLLHWFSHSFWLTWQTCHIECSASRSHEETNGSVLDHTKLYESSFRKRTNFAPILMFDRVAHHRRFSSPKVIDWIM